MSADSPAAGPLIPAGRQFALTTPTRQSLPLVTLGPSEVSRTTYGVAAMDASGRITDRVILHALGWSSGDRLRVTETSGLLTIVAASGGTLRISQQGYLRLPAAIRSRCVLRPGDRLLLAVDPACTELRVYSPAVLDVLLAVGGGEASW